MDEGLNHFESYVRTSQFLNALSGGFIFLFILGGAGPSTPLGVTYFLEVDTSDIAGALDRTRWTFFRICGVDGNGVNANCQTAKLAPLSAWDAHASGLPSSLAGSAESGRIREDIFGVWISMWILTFVWLLVTLAKLVDNFRYMEYSAMHIRAGRVLRYSAPVLSVPILVLFLYTFVGMQAAFSAANRDAVVGAAGVGFLIGAVVSILACEFVLYQLRAKFKPGYDILAQ